MFSQGWSDINLVWFYLLPFSMVDIHFQAKYKCIDHPRFGLVTGVFLSSGKGLKKGQEVFINYGYTENSFPHDFPWYWAMKKKADHDILKAKEEKRRSKKKKKVKGTEKKSQTTKS